MNSVVFENKDFLVQFLYELFEKPSRIKIQKTLYLLYAFYGATYGNINLSDDEEENEFVGQNYPKYLFNAIFEAWRYGPVEKDVYAKDRNDYYESRSLSSDEIDSFFNTVELKNIKSFIENIVSQTEQIDDFSLVDRTHQDKSWHTVYKEGQKHIPMDNDSIIQEYIDEYVKS